MLEGMPLMGWGGHAPPSMTAMMMTEHGLVPLHASYQGGTLPGIIPDNCPMQLMPMHMVKGEDGEDVPVAIPMHMLSQGMGLPMVRHPRFCRISDVSQSAMHCAAAACMSSRMTGAMGSAARLHGAAAHVTCLVSLALDRSTNRDSVASPHA